MVSEYKNVFSNRKFLALMLALILTILIDTSVVKVNDLIDKNFISLQNRQILFFVNSLSCLLLQYFIIKHIQISLRRHNIRRTFKDKVLSVIPLISLCILGALIGFLIFQMNYYGYYNKVINISIVAVSYGISATFIIWLSILFLSWYKSGRNFKVFLYFVAMVLIAFNLIMTSAFVTAKINDRPDRIGEFVGSSGDISGGRHASLDIFYRISSFMAFFSIWVTTAILMNSYREKLFSPILFWFILSIPLVYFLITFFYQLTLGKLLLSYLQSDPITVSIILSAFLSLSKPIGGLVFGVAFWNIARTVGYERNIKIYMIISGWGIFLIFAANQAAIQIVNPYPPFGLVTLTVLTTAGYLMLLGIYNSASLVSTNNSLRKYIRRHAMLRSNLLDLIGHAEMEKEIQETVTDIIESQEIQDIRTEREVELDEKELRRYIDIVIKEVRKG
ncbi:MAG TPA: hypothetical protein VIA09_02555 [Nitrososphaeraceae archaeon]